MTRRSLITLFATVPAAAQSVFDYRPALNPRLNALWDEAAGTRNTATIVSSVEYASLPPLRGWRDERFLRAYIAWSKRPEEARFDDETITADLGPFDWILFRRTIQWVWADGAERDPIGYTLFRLGAGLHRIKIATPPIMHEQPLLPVTGLSTRALPTIDAAIAAGKNIVTLYGSGFEGEKFEIRSEAGAGEILFAAHNQVNARVPSLDRVRLSIDGSSTPWVPVKKP